MEEQLIGDQTANCLIISANQVVTPYPVYPLGAAYITDALQRGGHHAYHFDMLAEGGLAALETFLTGREFDLVGISIRNLDTVDSADPTGYLGDVIGVAQCVRRNLQTTLVLGGPAFSIMPVELMELLGAEYGIVGEGETAVVNLASALAKGILPEPGILECEAVDRVAQNVTLAVDTVQYYLDHSGILNIQTKRGCPFTCGYCSYPGIEGRLIRHRDPAEVVEEIDCLQRRYGARYLFFADSVFNDPEKKHLELAEEMVRRKISLPWCAFFRPLDITVSDLRLLKRAGLAAMEFGTDASTDQTLARLNKGFRFADVMQVHERVVSCGISSAHFVMFGGPGEDGRTLKEGLGNLEGLNGSVVFGFVGIRILPGTDIFRQALADRVISVGDMLLQPKFYYSPKLTREIIESAIKTSFQNRLDRIYPCHKFNNKIASLHKMGYAGPLWDLLLKKRSR